MSGVPKEQGKGREREISDEMDVHMSSHGEVVDHIILLCCIVILFLTGSGSAGRCLLGGLDY